MHFSLYAPPALTAESSSTIQSCTLKYRGVTLTKHPSTAGKVGASVIFQSGQFQVGISHQAISLELSTHNRESTHLEFVSLIQLFQYPNTTLNSRRGGEKTQGFIL